MFQWMIDSLRSVVAGATSVVVSYLGLAPSPPPNQAFDAPISAASLIHHVSGHVSDAAGARVAAAQVIEGRKRQAEILRLPERIEAAEPAEAAAPPA